MPHFAADFYAVRDQFELGESIVLPRPESGSESFASTLSAHSDLLRAFPRVPGTEDMPLLPYPARV